MSKAQTSIAIALFVIAAFSFAGIAVWQHRYVPILSQFLGVNQPPEEPVSPTSTPVSASDGWNTFASSTMRVSVRYPGTYGVQANYTYADTGPGSHIKGVKFLVPNSLTHGTNLASDSGISVEQLPGLLNCSALPFLPMAGMELSEHPFSDDGTQYLVASTSGAGAGNFYEEAVYAIASSTPCTAVRYFIHSTDIGNYPAGTVVPYDRTSLLKQFDTIRESVVLGN